MYKTQPSLSLLVLFVFAAVSHAVDQGTPNEPSQVIGFGPDRVRLINASPFKQRQELHRTVYLRNLDPDRLLAPFFHNAKLPLDAKRYPGWDSGFIEGHMGGHYLSAASRMYAATGDLSYKAKVDHIIAGLKKCQQALDMREAHPGYLSAFPVAKLEQLEAIGHGGSVPYYTLHKILAGLLDAQCLCDNPQALDMAVALSDYIGWRMSKLSKEQVAKMLETNFMENPGNEHGGIAEALVDLFVHSKTRGDANAERHLRLASIFLRDWFIDPLVAGEDRLSGLHGNTHVAIASGLARYAAVAGDQRAGKAARQFWEHVVGYHSFVNGGNSFDEKLRNRGVEVNGTGSNSLAAGTAEYCNTHNMLKLTRNLFELSPRAEYADYFERALYNHILATIEPRTGQVCYLTSLRPGDFRSYLPVDGTFCCNGTGLENTARFGEGVYFHKTTRYGSTSTSLQCWTGVKWASRCVRKPNRRLTRRSNSPSKQSSQSAQSSGCASRIGPWAKTHCRWMEICIPSASRLAATRKSRRPGETVIPSSCVCPCNPGRVGRWTIRRCGHSSTARSCWRRRWAVTACLPPIPATNGSACASTAKRMANTRRPTIEFPCCWRVVPKIRPRA